VELQADYQAWLDATPENLADNPTAEALRARSAITTFRSLRVWSRRRAALGVRPELPRSGTEFGENYDATAAAKTGAS
jgi:hypothetical protein